MSDSEIAELRSHLRGFLHKEATEARLRRFIETSSGHDTDLWRRLTDELALQSIALPRAGAPVADLVVRGVVFEELGRTLACAPFLGTFALAAPALAAVGGVAADALLDGLADDGLRAALTWQGSRPSETSLRTSLDGALSGTAELVIDASEADVLLVAARDDADRVLLVAVQPATSGVRVDALPVLDTTRRLARVTFTAAAGEVLAADVAGPLDLAFDTALVLLAAEQLGGACRLLDDAVGYARTRVQFGRRIGSFQAVKHRCVDMFVDVELARSLVESALRSIENDPSSAALEAAVTAGFVGEVALAVATGSLQVHGGIGFTWEHSTHLYLKRAKSSLSLLGRPVDHRRRAAELLGFEPDAEAHNAHRARNER